MSDPKPSICSAAGSDQKPAPSLRSAAEAQSPGAKTCPQIASLPSGRRKSKWTPNEQIVGYRAIPKLFPGRIVSRGEIVRQLPFSIRQISPHWTCMGQAMDVDSYMQAQRVSGVLVLKNGLVVLERYGLCRTANDKWDSQSVTKSVTSILVGAAIQDGYIKSLDSLVTDYVHELKGSAYDGVTIRHLLMMTSGVKWNEDWNDPHSDAKLELSGRFADGLDPTVAYMRGVARADQVGAKFVYKTGETNLAGVLLSNAIDRSLSEYLSEKLWQPYGMENDAFWRVNSAGHEYGGLGLCMSLRDYARIGQFMLDGGMAGDLQVLPPGWVADATNVGVTFEPESEEAESGLAGYGYSWWGLKNGYAALGHAGQAIFVYPQDKVVVAINSVWPEAEIEDNRKNRGAFVEALRAEAVAQQP